MTADQGTAETVKISRGTSLWKLLYADKFALISAIFLIIVVIMALFGPYITGESASKLNLGARNAPPLSFSKGFWYILGGDTLGRSILARIIIATSSTIIVASMAVVFGLIVGGALGIFAGFRGGFIGGLIMRLSDILMGFPSLLLAVIILYTLPPSILNVVIVLAITRVPVYLRTVRAEVIEARQRVFVMAARVIGAGQLRIMIQHILPVVLPTLITVATLELATAMLAESALSFLGIGIQQPDFTWGAMVAEGRLYIVSAWWLSFWPGLAIILTTMSLNLLANWLRLVLDPQQRWRLERGGKALKPVDNSHA